MRPHHALRDLIEEQMHLEHVHSIDEMSCRLTGHWREPPNARVPARRIKTAIRLKLGPSLRCSIGLAPNVFLAKTASECRNSTV